MTDQHRPTDEDMQEQFVAGAMVTGFAYSRDEATIDWQLWQQERDATIEAAAEQRGAIKALQDLADNHTVRIPDILGDKVQAVFTETIWEKLDEFDRADRIANKEEGE